MGLGPHAHLVRGTISLGDHASSVIHLWNIMPAAWYTYGTLQRQSRLLCLSNLNAASSVRVCMCVSVSIPRTCVTAMIDRLIGCYSLDRTHDVISHDS